MQTNGDPHVTGLGQALRFLVVMASVALLLLAANPRLAKAAAAQAPGKLPRIGVLAERPPGDPAHAAFIEGLRELGYAEGRNIRIEWRYGYGAADKYAVLIRELLGLDVDMLVVGGAVGARAAKAATSSVPIVFTSVGDPVAAGLAAALSRPGANATGLSNVIVELSGKQLELLKLAAPKISRVAVLHNPLNSGPAVEVTREAARGLGLELRLLEVRRAPELAGAVAAAAAWRADAVLALSDPLLGNLLPELSKLAMMHRLPSMYSRGQFTDEGGLLAYGPSFAANYRRAATYVDRILKGARPGDLPVEQPTTFEFVVNARTAKALGLVIPQAILQRADRVIE